MKSLVVVVLCSFIAVPALAVNRPEPPRPQANRRASEISAALREKIETVSRTAREVLGRRLGENFEIKLPEGLSGNKLNRYERDLEEFAQVLRENREEYTRDSNKATEVANYLELLNEVYAVRPNVKSFLENSQLNSANREVVERTIDFIDNLLTIELTKMTETAESPVSQGQIIRTMSPITRLPLSRLRMEDFIELEAQITGILPKDYTMAKAARCVR